MRPIILLFAMALSLAGAAPKITRTSPMAVAPGATTEVTFFGDNLDGVTNLWASFSCDSSRINGSSSEAVFRITVPSNVPPQLALVRLIATKNLSDLHFLLVDSMRSVSKKEARKATPQLISADAALEGRTDEMQIDYFAFKAKKNEELSFELFARRIGSTLDPLLIVYDPNGRELVYSLQFNEPNGDPRFRFKAPASGDYRLELRDVAYHGGANYFYRLRFGHFPLITACFPPVIQSSNNTPVKLIGPLVSQNTAKKRNDVGSAFVSPLTTDALELIETEPNDKPAEATHLKIPTGVNGRFEKARDRDYYQFEVEKGDRLLFLGRTRSLGCPCDLSLRLFDTNNTQIAESSNTGAGEGTLTNTFEKAGAYRLLVEELTGAGAPDSVYHVAVKREPAGFALSLETDKLERSTNGFFSINVSYARDRYDGPITLSVSGLDSCTLENNTITAKKTNTTLRIKLPDKMLPSQVAVARIVGEAKIRDQPYTAIATTMPALRAAFPMLLYPPAQFDGLVWLGPQ